MVLKQIWDVGFGSHFLQICGAGLAVEAEGCGAAPAPTTNFLEMIAWPHWGSFYCQPRVE